MLLIKNLLILSASIIFFGCSTSPKVSLSDDSFAKQNLSELLTNQQIAMKGSYFENEVNLCHMIQEQNKIEAKFSTLAPKRIHWDRKTSSDIAIAYTWTCRNETNSTQSIGDVAGGLASVFSLGIIPTARQFGSVRLDVDISKNNKQIFHGSYHAKRSAMGSVFFTNTLEILAKDFGAVADELINQLIKELDRDGALEK
jgi:hypothetical protein